MTIVVGCAPTQEGRAALHRACQEALTRRRPLLVVRSAPRRAADPAEVEQLEDMLEDAWADLDRAGVSHEMRSPQGSDLSDDLISLAEEHDGELIVIGLRRRTAVGKLILGSSAQRILLDASCPVLAVKAEPTSD